MPLQLVQAPPSDSVIPLKASKITQACFSSVLSYFGQFPPPPETLLDIKFKELVFSMFSNPENKELIAYLNSVADLTKPELAEIMEANYTYNLSLEEFARISQRSLTAFKNEFTEAFKVTPGKWLIDRRLAYARQLLSDSGKNINEIVYESGFESPTHFSRVFKSKFGVSPLQYRKQQDAVA